MAIKFQEPFAYRFAEKRMHQNKVSQSQGVGLSYNVEFDTFKELLNIIFSGKNKKEDKSKKSSKDLTNKKEESLTPDYIKIKSETKENL